MYEKLGPFRATRVSTQDSGWLNEQSLVQLPYDSAEARIVVEDVGARLFCANFGAAIEPSAQIIGIEARIVARSSRSGTGIGLAVYPFLRDSFAQVEVTYAQDWANPPAAWQIIETDTETTTHLVGGEEELMGITSPVRQCLVDTTFAFCIVPLSDGVETTHYINEVSLIVSLGSPVKKKLAVDGKTLSTIKYADFMLGESE